MHPLCRKFLKLRADRPGNDAFSVGAGDSSMQKGLRYHPEGGKMRGESGGGDRVAAEAVQKAPRRKMKESIHERSFDQERFGEDTGGD